jgi:hypothetical protein
MRGLQKQAGDILENTTKEKKRIEYKYVECIYYRVQSRNGQKKTEQNRMRENTERINYMEIYNNTELHAYKSICKIEYIIVNWLIFNER